MKTIFFVINHRPPTDSQILWWFLYSVGIIMCVCVYLEAAVATVFEIATFPLAKVLHSRSIENDFFPFLKILLQFF